MHSLKPFNANFVTGDSNVWDDDTDNYREAGITVFLDSEAAANVMGSVEESQDFDGFD